MTRRRDKRKARKDHDRRDMAFFDTAPRLPSVRDEVWETIRIKEPSQ